MRYQHGYKQGCIEIIGQEPVPQTSGKMRNYFVLKCYGGSELCRDTYIISPSNFEQDITPMMCGGCYEAGVEIARAPEELPPHEQLNRMIWVAA